MSLKPSKGEKEIAARLRRWTVPCKDDKALKAKMDTYAKNGQVPIWRPCDQYSKTREFISSSGFSKKEIAKVGVSVEIGKPQKFRPSKNEKWTQVDFPSSADILDHEHIASVFAANNAKLESEVAHLKKMLNDERKSNIMKTGKITTLSKENEDLTKRLKLVEASYEESQLQHSVLKRKLHERSVKEGIKKSKKSEDNPPFSFF